MTELNSQARAKPGRQIPEATVSTSVQDYLFGRRSKRRPDEERRAPADVMRMILEDALEAPRGD